MKWPSQVTQDHVKIYFQVKRTKPPSGHGVEDLLNRPEDLLIHPDEIVIRLDELISRLDDLIIYLFYVNSRVALLLNGIIYVKQIYANNIPTFILLKLLHGFHQISHTNRDHQTCFVDGTNPRWRTAAMLKNWKIVMHGMHHSHPDPIGIKISGIWKSKMAADRHFER